MAPSKSDVFGPTQSNACQTGFKERGWDPYEQNGKRINQIIKGDADLFAILKPFFSQSDGGNKKNNNTIYGHYKAQASEYITQLALRGIRRGMSRRG